MTDMLPREILERPKQGFVEPVDHWMRGKLPVCIERALDPKVVREKGYFIPEAVASLLEKHREGENHGYDLVGVAMFHIWDDLFMTGKSVGDVEAGE